MQSDSLSTISMNKQFLNTYFRQKTMNSLHMFYIKKNENNSFVFVSNLNVKCLKCTIKNQIQTK